MSNIKTSIKPEYSGVTKSLFDICCDGDRAGDILEYIRLLEKNGADPFSLKELSTNEFGNNVFQLVFKSNHTLENKEKLLTHFLNHDKFNPEMLNELNVHGQTTLNSAIIYDIRNWSKKTPTIITQKFIDAGHGINLDFDSITFNGESIIEASIRLGDHEMTSFLIANGVVLDTEVLSEKTDITKPYYYVNMWQDYIGSYWAHLESLAALEYVDQEDEVESMGNLKPLTIQDFQ